jgi:Tol biopolymer transport system component
MVRTALSLASFISLALSGSALAAALQLSGGVSAGEFAITPDGSRIVFQSYNGANSLLYSARTDAVGSPTPISPNTGPSYLFNGKFTPDSSMFVFNTYETPADGFHVATYASRLDGSAAPIPLNSSKVFDDDPSQYSLAISPNSQTVAIRADQGDYDFDLLSRKIDASQPALPLNENGHSGDFGDGVGNDWTAAGNRVLFRAPGAEGPTLYSRVFDGSLPAVQLSPTGRSFLDYALSQDGSKVALTASGFAGRALFSRGVAGGPLTMLTGDDDNPHAFTGLYIDPHGQHVLFTTDSHLATIPTDGSAGVKSLTPNPTGYDLRVAISPDGQRVAFTSKADNSSPVELFVSPIDGSAPARRLSLPLPPGGNIETAVFSPDSRHIVYFGDQLTDGVDELFSVLADGSALPVRLTSSGNFRITPDGLNVIYAGTSPGGRGALYEIGIDGGNPLLLAENPYETGIIAPWGEGWQITPDGSLLIFTADDGASRVGIFAVAIPEPAGFVSVMGAVLIFGRRRRANLQ